MAALFGDTRPDGLIRVWRTLHRVRDGKTGPSRELTQEDMGAYPEGYWFEELPAAPEPQPGIDDIMLFSPATGQFEWEQQERPLTDSELMQQLKPRVESLEQATGVGGPGKAGIAKRLDDLAAQVADLQARVAALGGQ